MEEIVNRLSDLEYQQKALTEWLVEEYMKVNKYTWGERTVIKDVLDKMKELEGAENEL